MGRSGHFTGDTRDGLTELEYDGFMEPLFPRTVAAQCRGIPHRPIRSARPVYHMN